MAMRVPPAWSRPREVAMAFPGKLAVVVREVARTPAAVERQRSPAWLARALRAPLEVGGARMVEVDRVAAAAEG